MRALLFNIHDANGLVTEYTYNADGLVTSVVRKDGAETLASVEVAYDGSARPVSVRDQDGRVTAFVRDEFVRVLKEKPDAAVEYEYSPSGRITARTANGFRQIFEYDRRGQLVAVKEGGADIERYVYDKAGNMLRKTIAGKSTTFTFDDANQLVSSTTDGVTTRYEYDAAGRLIKEGNRSYTYGYLDKVMSVRDGKNKFTYSYHPDGQLATADYGKDGSEDFTWDGLALIHRGDEKFVNEPHVGNAPKKLRFGGKPRAQRSVRRARKGPRGNPVVSSKGTSYFNDMLGTTVGAKSGNQYSAATLSAFGARELEKGVGVGERRENLFFTGKPEVAGLGYAFLMRNYRAGLGKWQTADPLGYPENAPEKLRFGGKPRAQRSARRARKGPRWNALAYCNNGATSAVDLWGCKTKSKGLPLKEVIRVVNHSEESWGPCNEHDNCELIYYVDVGVIEYYEYVVDVKEVPRFSSLESMAKWLNGFGISATIVGGSLFVYGFCVAGTGVGAVPGGTVGTAGGVIGTIGGISMGVAELIRWLNGTEEVEDGEPYWKLIDIKPYSKEGIIHRPE